MLSWDLVLKSHESKGIVCAMEAHVAPLTANRAPHRVPNRHEGMGI